MAPKFSSSIRTLLAVLFAVFVAGCATGDDSPYDTAPDTFSPQRMLALVNEVRTSGCDCGGQWYAPVAPLTWNNLLEDAAYGHSVWMERNRTLSHTGAGGSNAGNRMDAAGYDWQAYGENVAQGYITEEDVMYSWLNSRGHCENIMNPDFVHMGAAVSGGYWTQVFGRQF
jgi:uncharacterized protein YkwD